MTLEGHSDWVMSIAFSPDGKQVISGSRDKTVQLWDAATGAALQTLEDHSNTVRSVAFSPNGKLLLSPPPKHLRWVQYSPHSHASLTPHLTDSCRFILKVLAAPE
jgi:WD40 repeat protein